MERHLKKLPPEILEPVYRAREVSAELGVPAYLIGGFVRDLLLSFRNFDLDIAVEGEGIAFARKFAEATRDRMVAHPRFGTATVVLGHHLKVDFASTRKEFYPGPASLPVVSAGSLKDDLFRRDFTINTLAISLYGPGFGKLLDLYGGKEDLEAGIVRILHDKSFLDDPTRILRAVRFEQRFNFGIEPRTLRLLRESAEDGMLSRVQPQRLRDELLLMVKEELPEKGLIRLQKLAGLDFIHKKIRVEEGLAALFSRIRDEAAWFMAHCGPRRHIDLWVMYLAALFSRLRPAEAVSTCRRFGLGKGESSRILSYVRARSGVRSALSGKNVRPSRLFRLLDHLPYEVILLIKAESRDPAVDANIERFFSGCHGTCVCISGHDLHRLGIEPGPEYQRIFRRLLDAKLNGRIVSREDELEFVGKMRRGAR